MIGEYAASKHTQKATQSLGPVSKLKIYRRRKEGGAEGGAGMLQVQNTRAIRLRKTISREQISHTSDISSTDHPHSSYDLGFSRQVDNLFPILYDLYDLAGGARWNPSNLHYPAHVSWAGSVTMQILHNLSQR